MLKPETSWRMKYAMQMMRTYPKHNGRHNVNNRSPPVLCKKHCNYFPLLCRPARYIQEFPLTRNGQHGQHPRVLECSPTYPPLLGHSATPPDKRSAGQAPAKAGDQKRVEKCRSFELRSEIMACVRARGISPYEWWFQAVK